MTIQTPGHIQRFDLMHDLHFSDISVTRDASNAGIYVCLMIEIGIIRHFVYSNPFDWFFIRPTFTHRKKFFIIRTDKCVAIHACFCGRHIGMRRLVDAPMTIAAINAKVPGMQFVAILDRLYWTVANIGVFGRPVIPKQQYEGSAAEDNSNERIARGFVRPTGK